MTCIVHHKDSKTGRVYVYESDSKWDKERKICVCTRKCLGHIDEVTGEVVPNRKRNNPQPNDRKKEAIVKQIGTATILNAITEKMGLSDVLQKQFPDSWDKILTCAYYLSAENSPLCHCEKWSEYNENPAGITITSQEISRLLASIKQKDQMKFFKMWAQKLHDSEYYALDITSISSYSKFIDLVKWGYNRDKEELPQINLAMLVGIKSGLPVYFNPFAGNITDITTLENAIHIFNWLSKDKLHLVMDRGFSNYQNINSLYEHEYKFTIGMPKTMKFTKEIIRDVQGSMDTYENYITINEEKLYAKTFIKKWDTNQCYVHVYYDDKKRSNDKTKFMELIQECENELKSGKKNKNHETYYDTYFLIQESQNGEVVISPKYDIINHDSNTQSGYYVLMSNDLKDAKEALRIYRTKDRVEKSFDNIKNEMDGKRLRVHSKETMTGRLFIQFIAQILISKLQNELCIAKKSDEYTIPDIFWEMKSMSLTILPGNKKPILGTLTAGQKDIMKSLNIDLRV